MIKFTSAQRRGFKSDMQNKKAISDRQRKRKDIEDLQEFESALREIFPEMFELEASQ
jgi:hypothetical protein